MRLTCLRACTAVLLVLAFISCSAESPTEATPLPTSVPAPPAPGGPDASVLALEDQVLTLVNQRRAAGATCGATAYPAAAPLSMNGNLRTAARLHSEDMAANSYFSHTSLDGRTFDQRIRNAGYNSGALGENIAAGYTTPEAVVEGWMTSPGHCSNIMSGSFRSVGVGYAHRAGSPFGTYWSQSFGGS